MPIDELHIAYSKLKLAKVALGGLPLIAAALALAFEWLPGAEGGFTRATGWVALLFFGACLGVILSRLFGSRGDVVTMTSDGLVDRRVVSGAIPWRGIRAVSVWEQSRQKVIVLKLDREIEKSLALKTMTKWTSGPNRALGADGICIASMGLSIDHDRLLAEIQARVAAAQEYQSQ